MLKPDNAQKYKKLRAFNGFTIEGLTIFNITALYAWKLQIFYRYRVKIKNI